MNSESHTPPGLSVVIPCLNEESTLPLVLETLAALRSRLGRPLEIIVSDNGSTDRSAAIAQAAGATLVLCTRPGYGAALKEGILAARHEFVSFADADNTYDFNEVPRLLEKLDEGCEFVIGSRLDGDIHRGAMPFLHRHLGTPILTLIINVLYGSPGARIRDCNSGFRAFRKAAFLSLKIESDGMEFASEMLIKILQTKGRFSQVPVSLRPDIRNRQPHLRTWRDGMRHLLQVLTYSQGFFNTTGSLIALLGWTLLVSSYFFGPVMLAGASILEVHTMLFSILIVLLGQMVWGTGLFIAAKRASPIRFYRRMISLSEGSLFWIAAAFAFACLSFTAFILFVWFKNQLIHLNLQKESILLVSLGMSGMVFIMQVLGSHLIKRS